MESPTPFLYLLICTTDQKILQNKSLLEFPTNEKVQMIIANQMIHLKEPLLLDKPFTQIINHSSIGISKNRNACLSAVKDGLGWILDDDVRILENAVNVIKQAKITYPEFSIYSFQIQSDDNMSYKNYAAHSFELTKNKMFNRQKILEISSIEIVFNIADLKKNNLLFDEKYGIGSGKYIAGEEVNLLQRALKNGMKIKFIPNFIVSHPKESSGKKYSKALLQTFGRLFRDTFGLLSYPFSIYFALKKSKALKVQSISLLNGIKYLWQG